LKGHPSNWPPPWEGSGGAGAATAGPAPSSAGVANFPPKGWPSKAQLDYAQAIIVLGLLVVALPWVVTTLVTRPGDLLGGIVARRAL
jgi:hypothetical protein